MNPLQGHSALEWRDLLSGARLSAYGLDGASAEVALRRHWWNLLIAESLYPTLQLFEVILRNRLTSSMDVLVGPGWAEGINIVHSDRCAEGIRRAVISVARRKENFGRDDWLPELGMGFWCELHAAHYEQGQRCGAAPFPRMIKIAYPGMPKSLHSRRAIKGDLERMRRLRNRVFHHERILHWADLEKQVETAVRYLGWMGGPAAQAHAALSRFRDIRAQQLADLDPNGAG